MNDRTLVYMTFLPDYISFMTKNRKRKSPHCFYILRSRLAKMERKLEIVVNDLNSFSVIRRDSYAGTIELNLHGCQVTILTFSGINKPLSYLMTN